MTPLETRQAIRDAIADLSQPIFLDDLAREYPTDHLSIARIVFERAVELLSLDPAIGPGELREYIQTAFVAAEHNVPGLYHERRKQLKLRSKVRREAVERARVEVKTAPWLLGVQTTSISDP